MKTQTSTHFQKGNNHVIPPKSNIIRILGLISFLVLANIVQTKAQTSAPWVTIATTSNVTISYQQTGCQGEEKLYLKIENTNATAVTVNWSLWGSATPSKTLSLAANETKIGECNLLHTVVELDEVIPPGKTVSDISAILTIN